VITTTTDQERTPANILVPAPRDPGAFLPEDVLWESWSLNGEACVEGLLQPRLGYDRLAHCLMWLVRDYASRCRRTFDGTGALVFLYNGPRTPTTLALEMSLWFDLALQDRALIRDHLRHRGCEPLPTVTPRFWLEGATHQYLVRGRPIPRGRVPRQKLTVLAEEQQVRVPAAPGTLRAAVAKKWTTCLEALAAVDEAAVADILARAEDEHGYLATILVAVHEQPRRVAQNRPSLEESWRRHSDLVSQLAPVAESRRQPIAWHALWRLPSGMSWTSEDGQRWMRYPAVSLMIAARPIIGNQRTGRTQERDA
jgi:hypothetical protein